jgi:hypothetical protein
VGRGPVRITLLAALCALAVTASPAVAARVVVLGPHGQATVRNDPFVTGPAVTPAPGVRARAAAAPPQRSSPLTVRSVLKRLAATDAITTAAYRGYLSQFNGALGTERRLSGTRRIELTAITENMHAIAAAGKLTPSRLPVLFETLARNVQWWTTGPLLSYGQRVEFQGSELVWEYYPGQGIELQELGSFGKADGFYTGGPSYYPRLKEILAELIPLAARRAGSETWEYYFNFDGGRPPWTSAMSQGTALEALTRAYQAFHDPSYLTLAANSLGIFRLAPTTGVRVPTAAGARYLQYSFAPDTSIINAFLQSLIGLYDYAQASGNPVARQLFAAGNAEAQAEVPQFDTGAWSLYQPGVEDSLDYHELVTGFLQQLCSRTQAAVYCTTAQHFVDYETTPPALTLLTHRARVRHAFSVAFRLSKISHVGIVVVGPSGATVFSTSAGFPYGVRSFSVPALRRVGLYTVRLAATDLAGNFGRIVGQLTVTK